MAELKLIEPSSEIRSEIALFKLNEATLRLKFSQDKDEVFEYLAIFNDLFDSLYFESTKDSYYWQYCPFEVYKKHFQEHLDNFIELYPDAEPKDFIEKEKKEINANTIYSKDVDLPSFTYRLNAPATITIIDKNGNSGTRAKINLEEVFEMYMLSDEIRERIQFSQKKKISFLNEILIISDSLGKRSKYDNDIFRSFEAFEWFENTLIEIGAINESFQVKRGFQAKAHAIFNNMECKDLVFKFELPLTRYIVYLNSRYSAKILSKDKMSDGSNHERIVKKHIMNYKNTYNKSE